MQVNGDPLDATVVRQHASGWEVCVTESLNRSHFVDLVNGRSAAIQVREFFSPELSRRAVSDSNEITMSMYAPEVIFPRVYKSGVALFDFYDDKVLREDYWPAATQADGERKMLFSESGDLLWLAIGSIKAAWRDEVTMAKAGGRELYAGMRREFSDGAKFHFDDVGREFPGIVDDEIVHQIAFNAYIEMPDAGGSLTVSQHPYHVRDERFRDGYGYTPEAVEGDALATITPSPGDAVFFCTRHLHSVEPVTGGGRRITFSFFIGMTADGRLVLWS